MLWIVAFVAMFIYKSHGAMYEDTDGWLDQFMVTVMMAMICLVPAALGWLVASVVGLICPTKKVGPYMQKLYTLRGVDGVSGTFFLGSGSVESQPYYFYYVALRNGGFRPEQIAAGSNTTIFEEDRQDAELIYYVEEDRFAWTWLIGFTYPGDPEYSFHLPEHSIKPGYRLT